VDQNEIEGVHSPFSSGHLIDQFLETLTAFIRLDYDEGSEKKIGTDGDRQRRDSY
jgi:hypothetical protein